MTIPEVLRCQKRQVWDKTSLKINLELVGIQFRTLPKSLHPSVPESFSILLLLLSFGFSELNANVFCEPKHLHLKGCANLWHSSSICPRQKCSAIVSMSNNANVPYLLMSNSVKIHYFFMYTNVKSNIFSMFNNVNVHCPTIFCVPSFQFLWCWSPNMLSESTTFVSMSIICLFALLRFNIWRLNPTELT